jgi:signal transduction histidine kinase
MEDLRRSLANLRAPGLGERKLSDALKTLANELGSRAKLGIDLRIPPEADQLQPAVAEALWRVAQEALTNVEKHALARTAVVALELEPQLARMRVTDDGAGLPPDAEHRPGHFGLRGLRERVEGLGGTLMLSGASNQGTVVEARLPIC